jgi:ribosome maturation factor RimP
MAKANIASIVRDLITPKLEELGYRIWDVEFTKEGSDWHLIVTIDCDSGIDLIDCETAHRAIDPILDEADPIEVSYHLDVSSPGIERELRTEQHILACIGENCEAHLFHAVNGKKTLRGTLTGYSDGQVTITSDGVDTTLPRTSISKLRTVYFD